MQVSKNDINRFSVDADCLMDSKKCRNNQAG